MLLAVRVPSYPTAPCSFAIASFKAEQHVFHYSKIQAQMNDQAGSWPFAEGTRFVPRKIRRHLSPPAYTDRITAESITHSDASFLSRTLTAICPRLFSVPGGPL
jgi:hypothetical protein